MSSRLKPKSRFDFSIDALKAPALALGVLLILAGFGSFLVLGFDTTTRVLLAVGILLVGVFVAIDPEDVWRRLTTRSALYGGNALLLAAVVVGILGLLNVVGQNRHQRWDLTANNQFSLSDQTTKILADLPQPVQVTAFYQAEDPGRQEIADRLKEYEIRSGGKVSVEFVDPVAEPARAQQAGIKEVGTTVMTMGDRRQTVTGSRETDFTTALLRLTNPTQKKIYFLTGHNERTIDGFERDNYGQLKTSLESDNYVVEQLLLVGGKEVPADATVLVVAQPRTPLGDDEKQSIKTYLDGGGKLMLLTQPSLPPNQPQIPLSDLVSTWQIEIGSAPVVEDNPQNAYPRNPSLTPAIFKFPSHKITEGLALVLFQTTTYITIPKGPPSDATITSLFQTTDRSWGETTPGQLTDPRTLKQDEDVDPKGPLTLAVAIDAGASNPDSQDASDRGGSKKTRVVIFGDADFVANEMSQLQSSNRDLFLNAANWLAEDEQLISIRPKDRDTRTMFLSAAQRNLALFSSILFLPGLLLAMGAFSWWSRR